MRAESVRADGYIHSKCCGKHWELGRTCDGLVLVCEACYLTIGPDVEVRSPEIMEQIPPAAKGALDCIHSPCCGAHWEVLTSNGKLYLACDSCGKMPPEVFLDYKGSEPLSCGACGHEME